MPEMLILEFTGVSEADYTAVNKNLGIDMQTGQGDWPPGLLSHTAGQADDGTLIVSEVWSAQAAQEEFMTSRLGEALAAADVTARPAVRWVRLLAYHQPGG